MFWICDNCGQCFPEMEAREHPVLEGDCYGSSQTGITYDQYINMRLANAIETLNEMLVLCGEILRSNEL